MRDMEQKETGAVILAGGRSTRMGANKALLRLRPEGPTIIEMVVACLTEAGLPPHLLVTNTPGSYASLGVPMVRDDIADAGALGGILTALTHSSYSRNLIVGCDMPFLNVALLKYMTTLPGGSDAIVPRWTAPGGQVQIETLHAIYSINCIRPIQRRISTGQLKVSDLMQDLSVQYIREPVLRKYDPGLLSLGNINTPEEFREASSL